MTFDKIIEVAKARKGSKVCLVAAQDEDALKSVVEARRLGITDAILVGNKEKIEEIAKEEDLDISNFEIIDEKDLECAAQISVELVSSGKASVLMKGGIATSTLLKKVLKKENGLRTGEILSHLAVFESREYNRIMVCTDGGVNILPDLEKKKSIINNAVRFMQSMGVQRPKVAILSAVEKINPDMPSTVDAAELVKMHREGWLPEAIIEGPHAMDIAMSKQAAAIKGVRTEISEEVDVFMVPNIEAGNIMLKSLIYFDKLKSAGIVTGAKCPIVLTSRSDSSESKLYSIATAIVASIKT